MNTLPAITAVALLGVLPAFAHEAPAAAGHPHAVFQLRPQDLEALTGAPVADVVEPLRAGSP